MKSLPSLLLLLVSFPEFDQVPVSSDQFASYFKEIKSAASKNFQCWNRDLYGPILLVERDSRKVYANVPDSAGLLTKSDEVYVGHLPERINFANTSIHWSAIDWAMMILPLPEDKHDRINLMAHELFHRSQRSLGFALYNTENSHLDKKDGRIYLRLELEALKKALHASSKSEMREHLKDAFIFRKYRNYLYAGSDLAENSLELNEGLAEFTGQTLSGRSRKQAIEHFDSSINKFFTNPSFVRSFPYQTIPVYGYLLLSTDKVWNRKISGTTNLVDYFIKAFGIQLPIDLGPASKIAATKYDGEKIEQEENARAEKNDALLAAYRRKFVDEPHLEIPFVQMHISFDPGNLVPLDDLGTVYPTARLTDDWGILTITGGGLISAVWDKISLTLPSQIMTAQISGEGWALELKDDYQLIKEESGNYKLKKK